MSKHQTAICQGSKFEICRFWSPEKNEIINIRFGSTFLEAYEFIKEEYKIEGNLFGCCRGVSPSLEKFTCEAKEKITFGLYEEARLSTKIIVNYKKTQIVLNTTEIMILKLDLLEACKELGLILKMFEIEPKVNLHNSLLETNIKEFQLIMKKYPGVIEDLYFKIVVKKISTASLVHPIHCICENLPPHMTSFPLRDVLQLLSELPIEDLAVALLFKGTLKLDCLISGENLMNELSGFRRSLFNIIFRPLNFRKFLNIESISDSAKIKPFNDTQKHITLVNSAAESILRYGLGYLLPVLLNHSTINLVSAILLSMPSLNAMKIIHKELNLDFDSLQFIIKKIIGGWKEGKKIYKWMQMDNDYYLAYAFSGLNQIIYICDTFLKEPELFQAMTLAHEVQHIIKRESGLIYSPLVYEHNEIAKNFFIEKNNGIPLEAGDLYWALIFGRAGLKPRVANKKLGNMLIDPLWWKNLPGDIYLLDSPLYKLKDHHFEKILPYSIKPFRKNLRLVG